MQLFAGCVPLHQLDPLLLADVPPLDARAKRLGVLLHSADEGIAEILTVGQLAAGVADADVYECERDHFFFFSALPSSLRGSAHTSSCVLSADWKQRVATLWPRMRVYRPVLNDFSAFSSLGAGRLIALPVVAVARTAVISGRQGDGIVRRRSSSSLGRSTSENAISFIVVRMVRLAFMRGEPVSVVAARLALLRTCQGRRV